MERDMRGEDRGGRGDSGRTGMDGRRGREGKGKEGRKGEGKAKGRREISPPRSFLKVGAYGVAPVIYNRQRSLYGPAYNCIAL